VKSIFHEVDHVPDDFKSVGPQGESTAEECLAGAGKSLEEAISVRRLAYQRLAAWKGIPGNPGEVTRILDALKTGMIKRGKLSDAEVATLTEHEILQADRCRCELEVTHWRGLIDWWRAWAALGLDWIGRTDGRA
jgi:hypothetical protein